MGRENSKRPESNIRRPISVLDLTFHADSSKKRIFQFGKTAILCPSWTVANLLTGAENTNAHY
jgi:hypothetical protein